MSVLYLERSELENINEDGIRKIINACSRPDKYQKMQDYYDGKHAILQEHKKDPTLPNNKVVFNMAKHTEDTINGYFLGKPVVYSSDNDIFMQLVQDIFDYNDEQDHNAELGKVAGIKGRCFEMIYLDEDSKLRLARVDPENMVMIYESGYKNPIGAIRTIKNTDLFGNLITKVEFWTWWEVWYFRSRNGGALELQDVAEHYWQDVPFVDYINNEECMGDFEGIISIIDAYNKVQSNTANLFQYNDEAILKVSAIGEADSQDIREMKEQGAIILEDGGDINWIKKEINDTALENYKDRLFRDMHIAASVPNMADESFGNNLSGVAMDYKLWNLEQICAIKERKFKKGLQRRIELITRILNYYGNNFDYREIGVDFRRNKPQNLLEIAQIFVMLASDVSKETRLKMLPMIENVQDELRRMKEQYKDELDDFGNASYDKLLAQLEELKSKEDPPPPTEKPKEVAA